MKYAIEHDQNHYAGDAHGRDVPRLLTIRSDNGERPNVAIYTTRVEAEAEAERRTRAHRGDPDWPYYLAYNQYAPDVYRAKPYRGRRIEIIDGQTTNCCEG